VSARELFFRWRQNRRPKSRIDSGERSGNGHVYFRATTHARGFAERGRCESRAFPLSGLLVRHKDRALELSASVCHAGNYAATELSAAAANYAGTSARVT